VSFGPDGRLYVTSTLTSQILRYSSISGAFVDVFVNVNSAYLFDARFGPDGDLYVPDSYMVLRYDGITGVPKPSPGQSGAVFNPGGFDGAIRGSTFAATGDPLISTDAGAIYALNKSTGIATVFASGQPGFHGLTQGPDGNVYAACPFTSEVRRYNGTTGAFIDAFVPSGRGGLNYAVDVAFGPDGDLYVASAFGQQILRYAGTTGNFEAVVATTATNGYGPFMLAFRPANLTSTAILSSPNPAAVGSPITFTATVSPAPAGGTVSFTDNAAPIAACQSLPLAGASATCTISYSGAAGHTIAATYSGTDGFTGSTSPALSEVVTATQCQSLSGCNLSGANLTGADLSGANLTASNLKGTNLTGTNLSGTNLAGSNLSNAPLSGANLSNANLSGANLKGANLSGANLSGANLSNANLTGANLTGATLTGAITTGAIFKSATWSNTICPDGTNSNSHGNTCVGHL